MTIVERTFWNDNPPCFKHLNKKKTRRKNLSKLTYIFKGLVGNDGSADIAKFYPYDPSAGCPFVTLSKADS